MLKKIFIGVLLLIVIISISYFFYFKDLYKPSKIDEFPYNPFENVTIVPEEAICTEFETKEFAFYLEEPKDFNRITNLVYIFMLKDRISLKKLLNL